MTLNAKNDKYGCPVCEKIAREEGLMNDVDDTPYCPVEKTLSLIGGKYKALILWRLMEGPMRFSQLARIVTGATPRTLTRQLRELEDDHLVHRHVYAEVPVRVEYSLTPQGESIYPILASMYRWGKRLPEGSWQEGWLRDEAARGYGNRGRGMRPQRPDLR